MIKDRKQINLLVLSCTVVYFLSYVSRINYSAVISEFISTEKVSKTDASLALTGLFITYGLGQLVSGYLGDRLKPKYIIFFGLMLASAMNALMPLNTNKYYMLAVWSVNGFAQAMMWPPIIKILTDYLGNKEYTDACVKVSLGSSYGTILIYLFVPFCILVSGWKLIFYFSAVSAFAGAFLWLFSINKIEKRAGIVEVSGSNTSVNNGNNLKMDKRVCLLLIAVMMCITIKGILRDGVTAWMPSYISETYGIKSTVAILTGVIAPIFSIISYKIASRFYEKNQNETSCAGVMFLISTLIAAMLFVLSSASAVFSAIASVLIIGLMHGISLILVGFVPHRFKSFGNVSTVSGILNFSTYVGSALSTYLFALVSENFGWSLTILSWVVVSACAFIICMVINKKWKRFINN